MKLETQTNKAFFIVINEFKDFFVRECSYNLCAGDQHECCCKLERNLGRLGPHKKKFDLSR